MSRIACTGKLAYCFLPWNLFLAWLPLLFAYLALRVADRRLGLAVPLIGVWLAFLPNARWLIIGLWTTRIRLGHNRVLPRNPVNGYTAG